MNIDLKGVYNYNGENIFKLPSSVKVIEKNCFNGCSNLTRLTIPSSVEKIEDFAFANCRNLKQVVFEGKIDYVGYSSFFGCDEATLFFADNNFSCFDKDFNISNLQIVEYEKESNEKFIIKNITNQKSFIDFKNFGTKFVFEKVHFSSNVQSIFFKIDNASIKFKDCTKDVNCNCVLIVDDLPDAGLNKFFKNHVKTKI